MHESNETYTGQFSDKAPRIQSTAESTGGKIAGVVAGVCIAAVMIMGTIKVGLIWFT